MISKELEVVEAGDLDYSQMSQQFPVTTIEPSDFQNQNGGGTSQGAQELHKNKKLNKLRSIKLSKSPSSRRRSKYRSNDVTADNPQNSSRKLIRRSSFKPVKSLTRMSSVKFKNPLMRKKSPGGTQLNKMNKSRLENSSPNFLKETCCSNERKIQFKGSSNSSESSYCSIGLNSPSPAHKCSTKSKNCSIRRHSETSHIPDSGVQRATCSWALKHSKSPELMDLQAEGSESEGISAMKHCTFTYCSLHGHRHDTVPPLKSLISIRRGLLKTRKGTKQATRSTLTVKKSGIIKEDEMNQMVCTGHDEVQGANSLLLENLGREVFLDIYDGPGAKPTGDGTCIKEKKDNNDVSNVSEKPSGYSEASESYLEESPKQTSDLVTAEQNDLVSLASLDLSPEVGCSRGASEVKNTDIKQEKVPASYDNEGADYSCTDKLNSSEDTFIPVNVDNCNTVKLLEKLARPAPNDVMEETLSDNGNHETFYASECEALEEQTGLNEQKIGNLETGEYGSVEGYCIRTDFEVTNINIKADKIAELYLNEGADYNSTHKLNGCILVPDNVDSDDFTTVELLDKLARPTPDEAVASTGDSENHKTSFASDCKALEKPATANERKMGSVETNKNKSVRGMESKNKKYIRMWKLMYKHAVMGGSADVNSEKPLPLVGQDQLEGTISDLETNKQCLSELDEHTALDHLREGDQNFELCQQDAIDLVQEAFDKILLPEVQDRSFDDQSVTSSNISDEEGLKLSHDEGGDNSTLPSSESLEDRMVQNSEERAMLRVENKLEQNTPKSWSSLKKFILLKRFVKEIEKVRNLNYPKPQYLPVDQDREAEKINLRHQRAEDKKNSDEWMLDYALQQVISKLPPVQQRRVALLVEAFESVLPFPEIKTQQRSKEIDYTADVQACNYSSVQNADQASKESGSGSSVKIWLGDVSCTEKIPVKSFILKKPSTEDCCTKTDPDIPASGDTSEDQKGTPVSFQTGAGGTVFSIDDKIAFKDPPLCEATSMKQDEDASSGFEVLGNETVLEIPTEHISIRSFDCENMNSKLPSSNAEASKLISSSGEHSELSENMMISLASIDQPEESMTEEEEGLSGVATEKYGFLPGFSAIEQSHLECNTDVGHVTQLEKQNYTKLWYFVYKHMVSGIVENDGDVEALDEAHDEQVVNTSSGTEMDPEMSLKNNHEDKKKNELGRIETIKLVEKAIDEILLPESQDESEDGQLNTRDLIPNREPPEIEVGIDGKYLTSTFTKSAKEIFTEGPEDVLLISDNAVSEEKEKAVLPKQKMSKNWRNLKRMILLNRFIKALEKGKKSNSRGPNHLFLELEPEAEKVNLKHQIMDERKNSEEWMLDYALQKAVAKLTPARSRKVALLVEAFETVIPNSGIPNPFKPEVI